jgi:adenylyltransferase/sulfurtransferase
VLLEKPLIDASILRFEGRLAVYLPRLGCYRCLFPEPPAPGTVPNCAEAGVIGALGGQMGAMQALEAIKLVTGAGESLGGSLLVYDALTGEQRRFFVPRDQDCAVCGDHPSITQLIDYEAFCGVLAPQEAKPLGIAVAEAAALCGDAEVQWLDVRPLGAVERPTIPGALRLPLESLGAGEALDPARPVVVFCDIGRRSLLAAERLSQQGIAARSLEGGIVAWTAAGLELTT